MTCFIGFQIFFKNLKGSRLKNKVAARRADTADKSTISFSTVQTN